jgi:hypothetical protein
MGIVVELDGEEAGGWDFDEWGALYTSGKQ